MMLREVKTELKRRFDRVVRPGTRAVILLYHRVADEVSDPYGLCVPPTQFEEHLRVLRELGRPTPLSELARGLVGSRLPERAISLTFDDGYLDNLENALPLLERFEIPATVFATTGEAGRRREFWWDELERAFLQPGSLPGKLELSIEGVPRVWELGTDAEYTIEAQGRHRRWHLNDAALPTRRHAIFQEIYYLLRPLAVAQRTMLIDDLLGWAGDRPDRVRKERAAMTPDQMEEISRTGLVSIGAHTENHPDLSSQDRATQRNEIDQSKEKLERWLDREIRGFAYPYGMYNSDSLAVVRETGFQFACSGEHHLVRGGTHPLLLPRLEVPAGGGDSLTRLLRERLW